MSKKFLNSIQNRRAIGRRGAITKFTTMNSKEYNNSLGETIDNSSIDIVKEESRKRKLINFVRVFDLVWNIVLSVLTFVTLFLFQYQSAFVIPDRSARIIVSYFVK